MDYKIDDAAEKAERQLVEEVVRDFEERQQSRRFLERGWQLNINFLCGNQYCDVNRLGEIEEDKSGYYWQPKRVFNYIAPTIETRNAKLARIRPALKVRAFGEDEADRRSAELSSAILAAVSEGENLDGLVSLATTWSETCGTAFYQIVWDYSSGTAVGTGENGGTVREGAVKIAVVPPFEIYPASLAEEKIENQLSIIHAKAVSVEDIYSAYGVKLVGRDMDECSLSPCSEAIYGINGSGKNKSKLHGYELLIERYQRPSEDYPDGRLVVVAGGKLLHDGALPYLNGESGTRCYPFVKQSALPLVGSFFGMSVIDRLIPVQRAYNAVKNRKHEFLNRISMGTVAVEDGSVDVDELAEDGLAPGKILVYRQGGTPPEMLTLGSVPEEFTAEEEKLQAEFSKISGVGELTQEGQSMFSVTSATGLQLLIEQDDARLNTSYQEIKDALKAIGRHVLRLYRQYASDMHLIKVAGKDDKLTLMYFKGSDISSDDVVLDADSDVNMTPAGQRTVLYELLDRGLFSDENGNVSRTVKNKILQTLGYKGFTGERDISELHRTRASEENLALKKGEAEVKDYDDHALHINEHTAFALSEKLTPSQEAAICRHIAEHKKRINNLEVKNGQPDGN